MNTNTQYKIVEGYKTAFEEEINKLAEEGWVYCAGSLVTNRAASGFHYAQLMAKLI